jgi:hypothetical protein
MALQGLTVGDLIDQLGELSADLPVIMGAERRPITGTEQTPQGVQLYCDDGTPMSVGELGNWLASEDWASPVFTDNGLPVTNLSEETYGAQITDENTAYEELANSGRIHADQLESMSPKGREQVEQRAPEIEKDIRRN